MLRRCCKRAVSFGLASLIEPIQPTGVQPRIGFLSPLRNELLEHVKQFHQQRRTSSVILMTGDSNNRISNSHSKPLLLCDDKFSSSIRHGIKTSNVLCEVPTPKDRLGTKTEQTGKENEEEEKDMTIFQRFKATYKKHGKILLSVHIATSVVWFGGFYYVARSGIDVVSWMEYYNFPPKVVTPFRSASLGDLAVMYLLYKLATPLRYTVTLGGTNVAIRYLKTTGYIKPVSPEDSIRGLMKDSSDKLKERRTEIIEQGKERIKTMKEKSNTDGSGDSKR